MGRCSSKCHSSRMLKKAKIRLLTRAAHCHEYVLAGVYRAATVRESVLNDFFSTLLVGCRKKPRAVPLPLVAATIARRRSANRAQSFAPADLCGSRERFAACRLC
jgi:hypothetical protein